MDVGSDPASAAKAVAARTTERSIKSRNAI
jgi:hypothetical protein